MRRGGEKRLHHGFDLRRAQGLEIHADSQLFKFLARFGGHGVSGHDRDRNLRLQYLAGSSVNLHIGDRIYRDILRYRVFPEDLFVGSATSMWGLRQAIEGPRE